MSNLKIEGPSTNHQPPENLPAPSSTPRPCPLCGKGMVEQPQFAGLWLCPDFIKPLNSRPPFEYKCEGMELTPDGAEKFGLVLYELSRGKN